MTMKLSNLTRTHQLVLGAIMGAINVIFALISSYVFAFSLIIMLFLPLASIIVAINIDLKYYPVYFLGTLFLALIINLANVDNTLFFLLPILASGLAFGLLIKHNINDVIILLVVSLVNVSTLFVTIPLINLIYDVNFLEVFATFVGFNDLDIGKLILPSILTLLAFMQTLVTLIIVTQDAKYFRLKVNTDEWKYRGFASVILLILIAALMFFTESIALALFVFLIFLAMYSLINMFKVNVLMATIALSFMILFSLSGIAILSLGNSLPYYFGTLFGIIPIVFIDILWLYISNKRRETIN